MFGGIANGHSGFGFPVLSDEQLSMYDLTALPHLQLFGKFPADCTINNINLVRNDHATVPDQKHHTNNFYQDNAGLNRTAMDPNHVSTGVKLSYGEDKRNYTITSLNHPLINTIQLELDRHTKLLDHYAKVQEQNFLKGLRELNRRHNALLLYKLEQEVGKKLHEKDAEIAIVNRRNVELGMKIRQAEMGAESWQYRAKYNESVVNGLKRCMQQVIMERKGKEGCGDSEVDDDAGNGSDCGMKCKGCNGKEVCVLLLPCRHLCLCKDCEVLVESCPVCKTIRTQSVQVFMG